MRPPWTRRNMTDFVAAPKPDEPRVIGRGDPLTSPPATDDQARASLRRHVDGLRGQVQRMEHEFVSLRAEVEARRITGPTLAEHQRLRETVLAYEARLATCRREHLDGDEAERLRNAAYPRMEMPW